MLPTVCALYQAQPPQISGDLRRVSDVPSAGEQWHDRGHQCPPSRLRSKPLKISSYPYSPFPFSSSPPYSSPDFRFNQLANASGAHSARRVSLQVRVSDQASSLGDRLVHFHGRFYAHELAQAPRIGWRKETPHIAAGDDGGRSIGGGRAEEAIVGVRGGADGGDARGDQQEVHAGGKYQGLHEGDLRLHAASHRRDHRRPLYVSLGG